MMIKINTEETHHLVVSKQRRQNIICLGIGISITNSLISSRRPNSHGGSSIGGTESDISSKQRSSSLSSIIS